MRRTKAKFSNLTIRDVARVADVSIGTVSRYLNGYSLRSKNRLRVEKAIKQLDFKENIIAKGLKQKRTMTVGVVIDHLTDIFMTTIVTAIEQWFEKNGYSIVLCDYEGDGTKLDRKLRFLRERLIDGLVLFPDGRRHPLLKEYVDSAIPIILINDDLPGLQTDSITIDNRKSSFDAVRYLHGAGHRSIAVIRGRDESYTSRERVAGYLDAADALGLRIPRDLIETGSYTTRGGYEAMNRLLALPKRPTAVLSCSYAMTVGALLAVNESTLEIPGDISLITFDNFEMFEMVRPKLSVIEQPLRAMGEAAAELMYRRMRGDLTGFPFREPFHALFLERESVGRIDR